MIHYRKLLPTVLALGFAGAAQAQTTPPVTQDDSSANDMVVADSRIEPDIVVAARVPQYSYQVGQAVTVLTRAEIERRQTIVLSDLLATTPGVTVTRNGGIGTITAVRIRGAEGEQTLTIIDGIRVNDPSSPGGAFDFGTLLAGSIDRIEILRGPNSVPWGSQAIGGVVNIVTATPSQGAQARGQIEYGAHNSLYANAGLSGGTGALTAAFNGGYLRTDGISAAANGTERDGFRQYGATGKVGVELAPGIGIDLRGYYADSRTQYDSAFPPPNYVVSDSPAYSTAKEAYGYAGAHANLFDDRFRNRVAFTIADIKRDNFDAPNTPVSFFSRGRTERFEYQGDFKVIDQLRIVGGAEHEDSRFNDGSTFAATGITSAYGEAIVNPVRQLTITGGVRHDDHRTFGGHTTFGADAALALDTGTTLRASYGEGFKAPTLYQLYSFYGTRSLVPETARSYDVGIQQRLLGNQVSASVTYFHRDTKNQIDFDLGTFTYQNIAQTRAEGVEVELALRPVEALTVTGNYSYIDAKNRSTGTNFGRDLARRPKQTLSVSADYRFAFGLSVGGTVSHVGDSFDNAGNTVRLDGYVLAGFRAEMAIGHRLSVYGRIDNAFNEKYQTVANYGTDGRAAFGGIRVKLD
ncbi:TonB-dependent receptor plug domain-containing protein [Sphingomonas psychrolutea]|uniref:TonB-dependent receptor plug domain-containing protein n=1 Tax=Sphingomonas psychrolutea TaxID=1259676 RepID=UPI001E50DDE2|nr:TonB-dependent receptor [Sphingomonas psychrolutea]